MFKRTLLATAVSAVFVFSGAASADEGKHGWNFKALKGSAEKLPRPTPLTVSPWILPKGFEARVVSDESDLNIYPFPQTDWHDMNVVNETGPDAGRYMYRTHELRSAAGAVSVVDLKTGETKLLAQDASYVALDGIRWTPWGTVLFAEETTGGRLFEIELEDDMMTAKAIHDRPAVGRLAHEGIDLDNTGNVYVVDEHRGRSSSSICGSLPCGGGIYKFVPETYGDLSSGDLYVLAVDGRDGVGQGSWEGPIDATNARVSGTAFGGQSYQRPEDLELINGVLYVAITEGPRDPQNKEVYEGRVIAIDLKTMKVTDFVKAGVNAPMELRSWGDDDYQTGFDSVDNLAEAPNGDLIMIEDNKPSDIWFASTKKVDDFGYSKKVKLFASLQDLKAEGTGIYFSPLDPKTLYVNIQHSEVADGDGTWAITRKKGYDDDRKKDHDDD